MTMCGFSGARGFRMAIVELAYVIAFTYADILENAGPFQASLRDAFGCENAKDY